MAGIDEDSKKLLDQVKKGKDLKFVLIAQGANVKKLIIYKTGSPSGKISEAKKDGHKGKAFWGEALGGGSKVVFQMSSADGFSKVPGKEQVLKTFILKETQLKIRLAYEIVDGAPKKPETSKEDVQQLKAITSSLKKLKGSLAEAIVQDPARKPAIMKNIAEIQKAIKAKDADKAQKTFDDLKAKL